MQKEIVRRDVSAEAVKNLSDLHPLLQRVYAARKITSTKEIERELKQLIPFDQMRGIDVAVECIQASIRRQESILIVGDFDADGATSTSVAVRALKMLGAKQVNFLVPNRFEYGYGLTKELVESTKDNLPDLIITVDNGIANHAGVAHAKSLGVKVVITDHHLAAETLPQADAIVNPNQPGCLFPSKCLAGVGVIFYVMLALRRRLLNDGWFKQQNLPEPNMATLLDLVALGTVADLVPLDHNNRILVHHGLQRMRAGQCVPGIVALLEIAGRDFTRTVASDLGFAVASRLNAAGRLDDMSYGIECLLTDDAVSAREKAKALDRLNLERRSIERGMQQQALTILDKLTKKVATDLPYGLCLFDQSWHQGVIGILASRIKDRFYRPVIVMAPGKDGELKGSGRSIAGFHLRDALAIIDVNHPGLLKKFGGHAMAAGLTINDYDFETFASAFDRVAASMLTKDQLTHSLMSDGELEPEFLNLDTATMLRDAGPWGQAFPEPLFDDEFKLIDQRIVGDKHLKLRLEKNGRSIDAIAFFVDTDVWPNHRCQKIKAAYKLDVNVFRGRSTVQLIVDYLEPV